MTTVSIEISTSDRPLRNVRTNLVQSIRAFHVEELQNAATQLGHHFLYANLSQAQTRQDVIDMLCEQFMVTPAPSTKNFDAVYGSITDPLHKSGPQPGFIVVVEQIPTSARFDKELRELLLDVFRDAADYWGDRKVAFRCFYSFSVARAAQPGEAYRQIAASVGEEAQEEVEEEKMPTDKIMDVSPLALRMSSPFNASYWLAAVNDSDSLATA